MPQLSGGALGGAALQAAGIPPLRQPLMQPLVQGMGLPPGTLPVTGLAGAYPPAMLHVGMAAFQSQLAAITGAQIQAAGAAADAAAAGQHVLPLVGSWPAGAAPGPAGAAGAAAGGVAAPQSQASSGQQQAQQQQQQLLRDPRVEQDAADLMRELAEEEMLAQLFADD